MTDVLDLLERGVLDPAGFDHRRHLEAAWLLLADRRAPFHEAYIRLRTGLLALAARAGRPERYHETLTLAFLALVHQRLAEGGPADRFDRFCVAAPDLLTLDPVRRLFGAALDTDAARAGLVLPVS